jgi:hypothetical protein
MHEGRTAARDELKSCAFASQNFNWILLMNWRPSLAHACGLQRTFERKHRNRSGISRHQSTKHARVRWKSNLSQTV